MAGSIKNLEIFSAGTWEPGSGGRVTVTVAQLDELVQSFTDLQGTNIVKPHLKLGHQDAQKWFGQRTGTPALGWVERVWREGTKLFANIGNVPDALISMIKNGRYHNVSVEIFPAGAITQGERKFGQVLSAIALLGTEMPAVKNLAGLASALFSEENQPIAFGDGIVPLTFSSSKPEKSMFTQEQVDSLIAVAVAKANEDTVKEYSAKVEDLQTQIPVLTARAESAEAKVADLADKAAFAEAEAVVDKAILAGKLLPKQKEFAMAFATSQSAIKFGDAEKSPAILFAEFLEAAGTQVDMGEKGKSDGKTQEYASAAHELDVRVNEAIVAAGGSSVLSYADAMASVFTADPDLKARYSAAI